MELLTGISCTPTMVSVPLRAFRGLRRIILTEAIEIIDVSVPLRAFRGLRPG